MIPERLERSTHSLEGCCSIQLSYGTFYRLQKYIYFSVFTTVFLTDRTFSRKSVKRLGFDCFLAIEPLRLHLCFHVVNEPFPVNYLFQFFRERFKRECSMIQLISPLFQSQYPLDHPGYKIQLLPCEQ